MASSFSVGQTVFVKFRRPHGNGIDLQPMLIQKVGRKWITIERGYRFDASQRQLDGGGHSSPGCVYLSEAEHQDEQDRIAAWRRLCSHTSNHWHPPDTCSLEMIRAALAALGKE
jgi:hypothetical protein